MSKQTVKEMIEFLKFHANDKANMATKMINQQIPDSKKAHFYHGQYMAFNEMYSLLTNSE
jgi:hypothetical protein